MIVIRRNIEAVALRRKSGSRGRDRIVESYYCGVGRKWSHRRQQSRTRQYRPCVCKVHLSSPISVIRPNRIAKSSKDYSNLHKALFYADLSDSLVCGIQDFVKRIDTKVVKMGDGGRSEYSVLRLLCCLDDSRFHTARWPSRVYFFAALSQYLCVRRISYFRPIKVTAFQCSLMTIRNIFIMSGR